MRTRVIPNGIPNNDGTAKQTAVISLGNFQILASSSAATETIGKPREANLVGSTPTTPGHTGTSELSLVADASYHIAVTTGRR